MLTSWDFDDTTEWLGPTDLLLAQEIIAMASVARPSVLEIGVWKGGWLLQLLAAVPQAQGFGIDPYPGCGQVRQQFLQRRAARGLDDRAILLQSGEELCASACESGHRLFDLIHVDGLHTEAAVSRDLEFAEQHLKPTGVLVVDDYANFNFPGVASAMYQFIHSGSLRPVAMTPGKAYLCHQDAHADWRAALEKVLSNEGLDWSDSFNLWYSQPTSVAGLPVLLVPGTNDELVVAHLVPRWKRETRKVARNAASSKWGIGARGLLGR